MREQHLWCGLAATATFLELLHEHLSNYDIIVICEYCREDDRHTILTGRHIPMGDKANVTYMKA